MREFALMLIGAVDLPLCEWDSRDRDQLESLCDAAKSNARVEPRGDVDPPIANSAKRQIQVFLILASGELDVELLQMCTRREHLVHLQTPAADDNPRTVSCAAHDLVKYTWNTNAFKYDSRAPIPQGWNRTIGFFLSGIEDDVRAHSERQFTAFGGKIRAA